MAYIQRISLIVLIMSQGAYGAGFSVSGTSASGLGNAFAGGAASNEDASVIWTNPAALSELGNRSQFSGAVYLVAPDIRFNNVASRTSLALTGGNTDQAEQLLKGKNATLDDLSVIPNLYFSKPISSKVTAGVGVNVPFGSSSDYNDDWYGRYNSLDTELQAININPSLAYRINDRLSVGGGLNIQHVNVELTSAIDSPAACLKRANTTQNADLGRRCGIAYPSSAFGNAATDSVATVDGKDWGYGFNVGVMYKPTPATRLGFHYRSEIDMKTKGDAKYDLDQGLKTALDGTGDNYLSNTPATAKVTMPASFSLAVAHQFNQRWEVLADLTHTRWSSFPELKITNPDTGETISQVDESWKDVNRVALGVNYQYRPNLKLRAGMAFEESPVPDAARRTGRTPDSDRSWLSIGAQYRLNKKVSLDMGYARLFFDQVAIDNVSENGYATRGVYDKKSDTVSAQLNWSF